MTHGQSIVRLQREYMWIWWWFGAKTHRHIFAFSGPHPKTALQHKLQSEVTFQTSLQQHHLPTLPHVCRRGNCVTIRDLGRSHISTHVKPLKQKDTYIRKNHNSMLCYGTLCTTYRCTWCMQVSRTVPCLLAKDFQTLQTSRFFGSGGNLLIGLTAVQELV